MIALATTTISVLRGADASDIDPWERSAAATAPEIIATRVRADIAVNGGRSGGPGDTETVEFLMICDPTDLNFRDTIADDKTGETYEVQWTKLLPALPGLEHIQAGLKQVKGFGNP